MKKYSILGSFLLAMACVNSAYATGPEWVAAYIISAGLNIEGFSVNEVAYATGGTCGVCFTILSTAIGGVAGFGTAAVMNNTVYSGCENQEACDKAKVGSYAGAALGTVGTVATVAMVGANAMSLVTIGATVGGGMAAGATILIAAPIIAAVAVGGATYWWFSHDGED